MSGVMSAVMRTKQGDVMGTVQWGGDTQVCPVRKGPIEKVVLEQSSEEAEEASLGKVRAVLSVQKRTQATPVVLDVLVARFKKVKRHG